MHLDGSPPINLKGLSMARYHSKKILLLGGTLLIVSTLFFSYKAIGVAQQAQPIPVQYDLIEESKLQAQERLEEKERAAQRAAKKAKQKAEEKEATEIAARTAQEEAVNAEGLAQQPIEDEGAPDGYIDPPPQCQELWWKSLPGEIPIRYTTKVFDWQTEVTINTYKLYANDKLVYTSASNMLVYTPPAPGTYTFHSIMETNFGPTLKSTLCTQTLEVATDWFN